MSWVPRPLNIQIRLIENNRSEHSEFNFDCCECNGVELCSIFKLILRAFHFIFFFTVILCQCLLLSHDFELPLTVFIMHRLPSTITWPIVICFVGIFILFSFINKDSFIYKIILVNLHKPFNEFKLRNHSLKLNKYSWKRLMERRKKIQLSITTSWRSFQTWKCGEFQALSFWPVVPSNVVLYEVLGKLVFYLVWKVWEHIPLTLITVS